MVLQLREVEGMEYQEISEATDLTMQQVKTYLHRGRHKIRALLLKEKISQP
jgi:DNA-directed RNA polymerase specialized sigma24 family protein